MNSRIKNKRKIKIRQETRPGGPGPVAFGEFVLLIEMSSFTEGARWLLKLAAKRTTNTANLLQCAHRTPESALNPNGNNLGPAKFLIHLLETNTHV